MDIQRHKKTHASALAKEIRGTAIDDDCQEFCSDGYNENGSLKYFLG